MNRRIREHVICFLAFLTPGMLYLLVWFLLGGYPFGERNILLWDMNQQYIDFFQYFKNCLQGTASLSYSFTKGLGGSSIGLYAYYLGSPLNFLVLFFEDMKLFCVVLSVLKFSFCGLTSFLYFKRHLKKLHTGNIFLLSQAYALMAYTVLQMNNIMWIDGVILLPLLLLAIDIFLDGKNGFFVVFAVAGCILFNWYTAYMSLLFSAFYFLVRLLLSSNHTSWKTLLGKSLWCVIYVLLGIGLSAFLFVPTIFSLLNGKGEEFLSSVSFGFRDNFFHIIKGSVIGTGGNSNQLNLFCGSIFLILALAFYFVRAIDLKEKLIVGAATVLLVFSAVFLPTDCVWNGFRYAPSYYCRYSYTIIITILLMAGRVMENVGELKRKELLQVLFGPMLLVAAGFFINYVQGNEKRTLLFLTVLFLLTEVVVFVFAHFLSAKQKRRVISALMIAVVLGELSVNMFECYKWTYVAANTDYQEYSDRVLAQLGQIEEREGGSFYRVETTKRRLDCSMSESMAYGYHGVAHYSSTLEQNVADVFHQMGYIQSDRMPFYRSPILTSDSLMGIKYLLSDYNVAGEEKIADGLYYNPYAFPLGFFVDSAALKQKIKEGNPFEYQNKMFSVLTGEDLVLFEPIDCRTVGETEWEVEGTPSEVVYGYIAAKGKRKLNLEINGQGRGKYSVWNAVKIFQMDFSLTKEDGTVYSAVKLVGDYSDEVEFEPVFYRLNMDVFGRVVETLCEEKMETTEIRDGYVKGEYSSAEKGYVMLSIPYETGWRLTINGKKKRVKEIMGCFLAVPVSEGDNVIELRYHVRGLRTGILVSIVSLTVLVLLCYLEYKKKKGEKS